MSYETALQAAGANIKEFRTFGDYQGTWIAHLSDNTFIVGYYGSCSGCDAFEAEFRSSYMYDVEEGAANDYNERLIKFGESYLTGAYTREEFLNKYKDCNEDYEWDMESKEIREWIKTLL